MERKRRLFINEFALKIIAMVLMSIDHIGVFLMFQYNGAYISDAAYQTGLIFRYIGRLAMPLFAFMIAEGVRHSKNGGKYLLRLGAMAIVMAIGVLIAYYGFGITENDNIFIDLVCGAGALIALKHLEKPGENKLKALWALIPLIWVAVSEGCNIYEQYSGGATVVWFPHYLRAAYGAFGFAMIVGLYYAYRLADLVSKPSVEYNGISIEVYRDTTDYRQKANVCSMIVMVSVIVIFWGLSFIGYDSISGNKPIDYLNMGIESYGILAAVFIYFYNGKRGYDSRGWRWFSYLYFPLHLVFLFLAFYVSLGL